MVPVATPDPVKLYVIVPLPNGSYAVLGVALTELVVNPMSLFVDPVELVLAVLVATTLLTGCVGLTSIVIAPG
jgi:hypothetical protein